MRKPGPAYPATVAALPPLRRCFGSVISGLRTARGGGWDNKKRKWLALILVRFLVVVVDRDFSLRMAAARRLLLRDAAAGLYAQMYYWGQDVKHAEGNLLVRYGMTRVPKQTPKGTSRYRQYWGGGWI